MFRPVKVRHYLKEMQVRGFSAETILDGSGLDADKLSDPACLIDFLQARTVISNMIRLTGNQGIGFDIGDSAGIENLGIVGHATLSSTNVRNALTLWNRYSSALVGMMLDFSFVAGMDGSWSILIKESFPLGFVFNFCVEEFLVINIKFGKVLVNQEPVVKMLELSYPAPIHKNLYHQYLKCTPKFNSNVTRLTFSSPLLDQPLHCSDAEFATICEQHCSQIMRQIANQSALVSQLRNLMMARRGSMPSLEEAATTLGMSARTLRRRLQEESYSYSGLINKFRFDLAKEYLDTGHITTKEIGYLLGFKDVDVFRRTFKAWTGQTISAYRLAKENKTLINE